MKQYIKPTIDFEILDTNSILETSGQHHSEQCSCYTHDVYGGCQGCKGNCGCNHWDPDLQKIIPGC